MLCVLTESTPDIQLLHGLTLDMLTIRLQCCYADENSQGFIVHNIEVPCFNKQTVFIGVEVCVSISLGLYSPCTGESGQTEADGETKFLSEAGPDSTHAQGCRP